MGFIMDGLSADSYDRVYDDRALLGRIGGYFRPVAGTMLLVAAMVLLNSLMDTLLPLLISRGIDSLAPGATGAGAGAGESAAAQRLQDAWVLPIAAAILVAGLLSWTFNFLRQWLTARTVADVVLQLRLDAFDAVLARDMSFYDEQPSGKIVSRVTSDSQDFAAVVTLSLNLLSQILQVFLITLVLFWVNLKLALWALTIAPVIILVALSFRRIARRVTREAQRILATVNAMVQESISGIRVAKAFRQERAIYDEFERVNRQAYGINLRQGWVFGSIFPILGMVAGVGTVLVLWFGGRSALAGEISAGEWYLFVQAIGIYWFPLTGIASFWSQFQQGLSASERVFALIDAEPRVIQTGNAPAPRLSGHVRMRGLDFRYETGEAVLAGFDLDIPAGQTLALVGHTGAGKSSIVKLISRFYEFQAGSIEVDGLDIRGFDLASYRRQLGIVPQSPLLFAGSLADNLKYARPEASQAELLAALEGIGESHWLAALPAGLETPIGEGGRGLSMGQRQLAVLARVLLQDPAIVILDEATASIDPLTEAQIQDGLDRVLAHRTAIIVAHRLSTVVGADRIVVLDHGRIIEDGTHASLLAAGGHYAALYNTYFRHQSADYQPGAGFVAEAG